MNLSLRAPVVPILIAVLLILGSSVALAATPTAPTNLVAVAISSTQVNLTWIDNSADEAGFKIERWNGSAWVQIALVGANTTSYADRGLVASTRYYYHMAAYNSAGYSSYSNTANVMTLAAASLSAPTGLTATSLSSSQIKLVWTDNSTSETGFALEWAFATSGPFSTLTTPGAGATSYTVGGLTASTTYYFRIRATSGTASSAYSNVSGATTLSSSSGTAPAAPTNLTVAAVSTSSVTLAWTDNSTNETGFKLERATVSTGPYTQIAVTGASVTGYSDTGLAASTAYYYRGRATNAVGDSTYSNTASATTQAAATTPAAPSNLTATALSSTAINLAWTDNSTNETGFKVERATSSAGPWSQRATTAANSASYSDSGLTASTVYYYRVSAYNGSLYSATSSVAAATTQAVSSDTLKPTAPTKPTVVAPACGVLTVTWTGSTDTGGSGLRGYKIYRSGSYYTQALQPPTGSVVSFTDTGLREALFYAYEISAIDNAGNESAKCPIFGTYTLSCAGAGGDYQWAQRAGGAYLPDSGSALAVDASGNIYVIGQFQATSDFPSGALVSAGFSDVFVAKYAPDGTNLWAKGFGGPYDDLGKGIAVDASGNVFVAGQFQGTAGFGTSSMTSAGSYDIFLMKLSGATGTVTWKKSIGGTGIDMGNALALDGSGNVILTGSFRGTVDLGGGAAANTNPWSLPFLAKYSGLDGSYQWAKRFGRMDGALNTQGTVFGISIDVSGNIAIAGTFGGPVDFGGGALAGGTMDVFVAKYSSSGGYLWAKGFGDASDQQAFGLAFDHTGNVVLTGYFMGAINFGGGVLPNTAAETVFLAKLSGASGAHIWSKSFTATSMYRGFGYGLAVDGADNVLLTGFGSGPIDFGGGPLTSDSATIFAAKFSTGGYHVWSKRFRSGGGQGNAVIADGTDNMILTGSFQNLVDFGFGDVSSAGGDNTDFFLAKLKP